MTKYRRALQIILPIIVLMYVGAMIYVATSTNLPGISSFKDFDKVIHMVEFFILIILLLFTFAVYDRRDARLLALATSLVFIVVSEVLQIPILNRTFSVADIMADLVGVALGFALVYVVDKQWNLLKRLS